MFFGEIRSRQNHELPFLSSYKMKKIFTSSHFIQGYMLLHFTALKSKSKKINMVESL